MNKFLGIILAVTLTFGAMGQDPKPIDITPQVDLVANPVDLGEVTTVKAVLKNPPKNLQKATLTWKIKKNSKEYKNIVFKDSDEKDAISADTVIFGVGISPATFNVEVTTNYLVYDKDGDKATNVYSSVSTTEKTFKVGKVEPEEKETVVDTAVLKNKLTPIVAIWADKDREQIRAGLSRTYSMLGSELINNSQLVKSQEFVTLYRNRMKEGLLPRSGVIADVVEKTLFTTFLNKNETLTAAKRKEIASLFYASELVVEQFAGLQPPTPGPEPDPDNPPAPPVIVPEGKFGLTKFTYDGCQKITNKTVMRVGAVAYATGTRNAIAKLKAQSATGFTLDSLLNEWASNVKAAEDSTGQAANIASSFDPLGTELQTQVYSLYKDKKAQTTDEWLEVLSAIADGYEKVK